LANSEKGGKFLDERIAQKPKLRGAKAYLERVQKLWRDGLPPGDKTGWPLLDKHYSVAPGLVTIVTGWPGSGKSEWLDALLVHLSRHGWKFAMFSFENQPVEFHIHKMLEKLSGKPFGAGPTERMTLDEVNEYTDELDQSFSFVGAMEKGCSLGDVLEEAGRQLAQFPEAKRGLVVDPWNELEHWRMPHLSETEYVAQQLSIARNWARVHDVHIWVVAHPQKMRREDGKLPVPRPDMISGSQNWWNKADWCITVHRDFDKLESQDVDIYVQKVRFKWMGRAGFITLKWDRVTGRYFEPFGIKIQSLSEYRKQTESA
jgi:twinkle protein